MDCAMGEGRYRPKPRPCARAWLHSFVVQKADRRRLLPFLWDVPLRSAPIFAQLQRLKKANNSDSSGTHIIGTISHNGVRRTGLVLLP